MCGRGESNPYRLVGNQTYTSVYDDRVFYLVTFFLIMFKSSLELILSHLDSISEILLFGMS